MTWLKQPVLRVLRFLFSDKLARQLACLLSRRLVNHLRGEATNGLLQLLLGTMDTAFLLVRSYRANIVGFRATYQFRTDDGAVVAVVRFADGDMTYEHAGTANADATVDFKSAAAMRRFLFSAHQDILESLKLDEVHVHGNVNYVYKFAFLARDLECRILGNA